MTQYKVTQGFTSSKPYVVNPNGPGRWTWQGAPSTINSSAMGGATVQHGVAKTLVSPGSGTKSDHTLPGLFDPGTDAAYGATSAQWTATGSKLPVSAGGIYNIQNQPPGFSPSGWFIPPVNPFIKAVIAGCHLVPGSNDSNGVYLGYAFQPNGGSTVTYPFCSVWEYDYLYDPNMFNDPQTDNNTKTMEFGDTQSVYGSNLYAYVEPSPITQFPISNITQANPCVVTSPYNSAVAPAAIGDVITLFGIEGMVQINGMAATVSNVTGGFGAWVITLGAINSTSFSAYASAYTISAATATNPAVITLNTVSTNHPLGATGRDWVWVTGAAGGSWTQLNQYLPQAAAVSLGGSSGAWTAQLVVGFATGTGVNAGSWGTYTANSGSLHTGGFSVAFSVLGAINSANTYITTRGWDMNGTPGPQLQGPPDANGNGSGSSYSASSQLNMPSAPSGSNAVWKRRRVEMCWSQFVGSPGNTGPGYVRIYENNVLKWHYVGQSDNTGTSSVWRQMAMGSVYHRDRGINNFCYFANPYYDWSPVGGAGPETGQVYRVYAGDQSTFAACTNLVPQPFLGTITNTSVPLTKFWQGSLADSSTCYFYATPEGQAPGTAVALHDGSGNYAFTITPVSKPSITTSSLPGATVGSAYNSGAIAVTGGTGPYTYYLASAATGGGYNAQPSRNTWAISSSTGTITGTPVQNETDLIAVTVIDANGYNASVQFNLVVGGALFAPNRPYGITTLFDRQWAATDLPGGTMPHTDGYGMTWQTTGGPLGPFLGTPAQVLTQTGLTVPLPPDGGGAAGSMLVYQYQSGQTVGSCPFEVFWPGTFSYQQMYVCCWVFMPSTFNSNSNNMKWLDIEQHTGTGSANHILMLSSNGAGQVNAGGVQDYRAAWVTLQGGVNNNYGGSNSDPGMVKQLNPGGGYVSSQGSGPGWWTTTGNNGVWVLLEWVFQQESTAGVSSDGWFKSYWNGTLINFENNIRWNAAGDPNCFNVAVLNAYYGGGGSAAPSNQYLMVGRFMVAGA